MSKDNRLMRRPTGCLSKNLTAGKRMFCRNVMLHEHKFQEDYCLPAITWLVCAYLSAHVETSRSIDLLQHPALLSGLSTGALSIDVIT